MSSTKYKGFFDNLDGILDELEADVAPQIPPLATPSRPTSSSSQTADTASPSTERKAVSDAPKRVIERTPSQKERENFALFLEQGHIILTILDNARKLEGTKNRRLRADASILYKIYSNLLLTKDKEPHTIESLQPVLAALTDEEIGYFFQAARYSFDVKIYTHKFVSENGVLYPSTQVAQRRKETFPIDLEQVLRDGYRITRQTQDAFYPENAAFYLKKLEAYCQDLSTFSTKQIAAMKARFTDQIEKGEVPPTLRETYSFGKLAKNMIENLYGIQALKPRPVTTEKIERVDTHIALAAPRRSSSHHLVNKHKVNHNGSQPSREATPANTPVKKKQAIVKQPSTNIEPGELKVTRKKSALAPTSSTAPKVAPVAKRIDFSEESGRRTLTTQQSTTSSSSATTPRALLKSPTSKAYQSDFSHSFVHAQDIAKKISKIFLKTLQHEKESAYEKTPALQLLFSKFVNRASTANLDLLLKYSVDAPNAIAMLKALATEDTRFTYTKEDGSTLSISIAKTLRNAIRINDPSLDKSAVIAHAQELLDNFRACIGEPGIAEHLTPQEQAFYKKHSPKTLDFRATALSPDFRTKTPKKLAVNPDSLIDNGRGASSSQEDDGSKTVKFARISPKDRKSGSSSSSSHSPRPLASELFRPDNAPRSATIRTQRGQNGIEVQ